jgi:hypothetical protein
MPQTLELRCHNSFQDQDPFRSLQESWVVPCQFLLSFSEYDCQQLCQFVHVLRSC